MCHVQTQTQLVIVLHELSEGCGGSMRTTPFYWEQNYKETCCFNSSLFFYFQKWNFKPFDNKVLKHVNRLMWNRQNGYNLVKLLKFVWFKPFFQLSHIQSLIKLDAGYQVILSNWTSFGLKFYFDLEVIRSLVLQKLFKIKALQDPIETSPVIIYSGTHDLWYLFT